MADLFSVKYQYLWMLVLAIALYFPARQLIWVLMVRRAERALGSETDSAERLRLKRRAGITSALLCFVFSVFYVGQLFQGRP
jgi:hypothetical protein